MDFKKKREENEKELIESFLIKNANNKTKAAKDMGVDKKTLYNKIKSLGVDLNRVNLQIASKLMPE